MNPARVDLAVDLAYGVVIFASIALILEVGTGVGVAFGLGALISYIIHIGWKMSRFDPDWMTREVAERVEESVTREVETTVKDTVDKEVDSVAEKVKETVSEEVSEAIEKTVSEEMAGATEEGDVGRGDAER